MKGGDDNGSKAQSAQSSSSSSSMKLLLFMVPLLVASIGVAFLGPKASSNYWDFISHYHYHSSWPWTSSSSSSPPPPFPTVYSSKFTSPEKSILSDNGINREVEHENDSMVINLPPASSPLLVPLEVTPTTQDQQLDNKVNNDISASSVVPLDQHGSSAPAMNETTHDDLLTVARVQRPRLLTKLQRLEAGLRRARSTIRMAKLGNQTQLEDADYVPLGPMYWNANAFHRSYLEMEKQFKVYVYEEGEPPVFHNGPCKSIYSMEGNFIHGLERDKQFRTMDPEKAHVYFLPFSVTMLVRFVYVRNSHDFGPIKRTVLDYVNVIAGKYPFWNRSLAADHFMLACHDWGPETSLSAPHLYENSIRVLCNANISEGFNPSKDVSFPEVNLQTGNTNGFIGGPSPSRRPTLAFFAGGLHGPIRPVLLEHWENKDEDMRIHRYLPKGLSYYDMMRNSKYCICPSGYEVASPRIVEALYTGCVPVLISDHYVPPFSDVLNWKSFSVEVSVNEIPNLKRILMSISTRQYIRMQRRGKQVRRHFEVNSPPKRYDVYHMILHSIWLRRLNVRVHHTD